MDVPVLALSLDLALVLYVLAILVTSLTAIRGLALLSPLEEGLPGSEKTVSIILPVKDEADTIRESIKSLLDLEYHHKEIIVVVGQSRDATSEILREFGARVKIVAEQPRPAGWLGKCWACHTGFLISSGEVLLFTDGDVYHSRNSLASSLAYLEKNDISLLSVWPRVITRVPSERALFPLGAFFLSAGIAARGTKATPRGRVVRGANGQYILITREAYAAVGGHEAVKASIIEDGAIGRRVVDAGLPVQNLDGKRLLSVRPYASFREIWIAFERFSAGLLPKLRDLLSIAVLSLLYFTSPVVLLIAGLAESSAAVAVTGVVASCLSYGTTLVFYRKHSHARYVVFTPLAGLVMVAAFIRGFTLFHRGGVEWKGLRYKRGETRGMS